MMVFFYTSGQSMPLRQIRSGLLRTPTISTFCIIPRCDDSQYLDGPIYPYISPNRRPQMVVLNIRDPKEGKASPNIWSLTH